MITKRPVRNEQVFFSAECRMLNAEFRVCDALYSTDFNLVGDDEGIVPYGIEETNKL